MELRRWDGTDVPSLTALLHRAYRPLLDRGLHYVAATQDDETTRRRTANRECWIAYEDGAPVGTVTLTPPGGASGCDWYARSDVAAFGQFAVEPTCQGSGLGSQLLAHVEGQARALGAAELACDTAEQAQHLRDFYLRRGFRIVDAVDWPMTNFASVVLSKTL